MNPDATILAAHNVTSVTRASNERSLSALRQLRDDRIARDQALISAVDRATDGSHRRAPWSLSVRSEGIVIITDIAMPVDQNETRAVDRLTRLIALLGNSQLKGFNGQIVDHRLGPVKKSQRPSCAFSFSA